MNLDNENQRHLIMTSGPVGSWRVLPGTHTAMFDGQIDFDVGGTGQFVSRSVKEGERSLHFLWRMSAHGMLECQPQHQVPLIGDDGRPEIDDWHCIRFMIERVASDVGHYWAVRETGCDGFWEFEMPLVPKY
jgi:hypothetical protein